MITDARALRPTFVPRDLEHRDGQIDHLSTVLAPITEGQPAESACVFGPSGAGKTTLVKHTLDLLEREALEFRWGLVSCVAESSRAGVLFSLVRQAGLGRDLTREGTHEGTAIDRLREFDGQLVLAIDEVDVLDDTRLLQGLIDIPDVSLVMISADEDQFLTDLSDAGRSRVRSAVTLRLERYSLTELVDILEARVDHGLIASRVDAAALRDIADRAAGDAREAIALLRFGAKFCEQEDVRELSEDVVAAVADDAAAEIRNRRVRDLGTHKRLLYELVEQAGEIDSGTLHARYEDKISDPRAESTRRKYLASLARYELIEAVGETRDRRYRAVE